MLAWSIWESWHISSRAPLSPSPFLSRSWLFCSLKPPLLVIYYASVDRTTKYFLGAIVLLVLLPLLGSVNGYFLKLLFSRHFYRAGAGTQHRGRLRRTAQSGFRCVLCHRSVSMGDFWFAPGESLCARQLVSLSSVWFFPFLLLSVGVGA